MNIHCLEHPPSLALLNRHPHPSVCFYRAIKAAFECGGGGRQSATRLEIVPSITTESLTRRGWSWRANCNRCSQSVVLVPAGAEKLPPRRTQPSGDDAFPPRLLLSLSDAPAPCLRVRNTDRNVSRRILCLARGRLSLFPGVEMFLLEMHSCNPCVCTSI